MLSNTTTVRHLLAKLAVLTAMAVNTLPARAQETVVQTTVVSASDLNLATAAGQEALKRRILIASRKVCDEGDGQVTLDPDVEGCRKAAFQKAWSQARTMVAAAKTRTMFATNGAATNQPR